VIVYGRWHFLHVGISRRHAKKPAEMHSDPQRTQA